MGIFSFNRTRRENENAVVTALPVANQQDLQEKKPLTVSYATGWPIDVIYGYLHKNYEDKGQQDALLNSNLVFRDMNMSIIRNKILMVFREINLCYDAKQSDLETRIETCQTAGLLTTVAELQKNMAIIHAHKAELKRLEADFVNDANEASVPLQSYSAGFLRGIANVAIAGLPNNTTIMSPMPTTAKSSTTPLDAAQSA